jgi:hypothetical protein
VDQDRSNKNDETYPQQRLGSLLQWIILFDFWANSAEKRDPYQMLDLISLPWRLLSAKEKAEFHVLAKPHDVVGSPGIVEEVAMNARGQVRLVV